MQSSSTNGPLPEVDPDEATQVTDNLSAAPFYQTRSGRNVKLATSTINEQDASSKISGELLCMSTLCPDAYHGSDCHPMQLPDLFAMAISNDPDTLTYQEAMQAPDKGDFQKSMSAEIDSQMKLGAYDVVSRSSKPPSDTLLPAVWAFRHW